MNTGEQSRRQCEAATESPNPPQIATGTHRRRRCRDAIAGKSVDRAPAFILSIACEVSSRILGREAYTGTGSLHYAEVLAWARGEKAHEEFEARMWRDLLEVHRILDLDGFHPPWRMNVKPTRQLDEYTFLFGNPDADHVVYQYNPESADFSPIRQVTPPQPPEDRLRARVEAAEADLGNANQVLHDWRGPLQEVHRLAGEEFFIVMSGGIISAGITEEDMLLLAMEPELVRRQCAIQARNTVTFGRALIDNGIPPVMLGGGDLAGQQGPFYSPQAFREVLLPAYCQAMSELARMGVHYVFRSDGNLWPLTDMLFNEAGCPGYGEVDREATMTLAAIRRRYPQVVVWGNFPSAFLCHATAAQVREEAARILEESGGTRYFQGCSNAIVKGTPIENVEALFAVR